MCYQAGEMAVKKHLKSLYVFNHDLRLSDNRLLFDACQNSQQMMCLYCLEPWQFQPAWAVATGMGPQRWQFLYQSLAELHSQLRRHDMSLVVRLGHRSQIISELINEQSFVAVFQSHGAGDFEQRQWQWLKRQHPGVDFCATHNQTLFDADDLPFRVSQLPASFTPFRKQVEDLPAAAVTTVPLEWPEGLSDTRSEFDDLLASADPNAFSGGQAAAEQHVNGYFNGQAPSTYKQVRNALDGWRHSTKFSPWLALGCVSPRQVLQRLRQYETTHGANESTYWIYFELLWREYFYWYARRHGARLFFAQGIKSVVSKAPDMMDQAQLQMYQKWCHGETGAGLIDACMRQLNSTGYMSNRGRQVVASYFINELQLDWRWGAQYFEQRLIDYDVGSNWGNWQYIAGVGADPRGGRHFNWLKQQQTHDPEGAFVAQWVAKQVAPEWVTWEALLVQ